MRVPRRFSAGTIAVAVATTIALAPAAEQFTAAGAARVTAPKSGAKYSGSTAESRKLTLHISGRSIEVVAFRFDCNKRSFANTSLQAIALARTSKGYRFKINAHALVSYGDQRADQNAPVFVEGRFSRSARTVRGRFRVRAPGCDTGYVTWRARR